MPRLPIPCDTEGFSEETHAAVRHIWKEPKDLIPQAVRQVRDFLRTHRPVTTAR
jgi:hypothetical protein